MKVTPKDLHRAPIKAVRRFARWLGAHGEDRFPDDEIRLWVGMQLLGGTER